MTASGEVHSTSDSEITLPTRSARLTITLGPAQLAGREKKARRAEDSTEAYLSSEVPTSTAILKIYSTLLPESGERILSMVEREQHYERRARRAQDWLSLVSLMTAIGGVILGIIALISVGFHSAWPASFLAIIGGILVLVAVVASTMWLRVKSRLLHHETSDDQPGKPDD